MNSLRDPRQVGIVIFDRCQIIDATGPGAVFGAANEALISQAGHAGYDVRLIAPAQGPVKSNAGISVYADHALSSPLKRIHTLICAGGKGTFDFISDVTNINAVRRLAKNANRIVSVCTGAFILAEAGLLNGRRAVTHWAHCRRLADRYPDISVEVDPIFIRDGDVLTSAGVTAGMDLALALVEADHGRDIALSVARDMVMYFKRPGTQAQFSRHLSAQMAPEGGIRSAQLWLLDNLNAPIGIHDLAEKASMSPRSFNRHFKRSTGMTPARYIAECRIDAARRLLEESSLQIKAIAATCGFGDEERMRRTFHRHLGVSPDGYRARFGTETYID